MLAGGLAVLAAACGELESSRPLELEPGVYKGQPDEPLTEAEQKALTGRANLQR